MNMPQRFDGGPDASNVGCGSVTESFTAVDKGTEIPPPVQNPRAEARGRRTHWQDLTDRETEVLASLCDGLSNKQIAVLLSVTEATVKFHSASVFKKLGVLNRISAVNYAYRNRLAPCPCGDGGAHLVFVNGSRYVREGGVA